MSARDAATAPELRAKLPRSIWALGFVSLLMDTSSEMIHSLLPVFLVVGLGASAATVGLIEGVGEATASVTRLFSGWVSDRVGRRKPSTVVGYAIGALSKPLFAIAPSPAWVLGARFSDRLGKGIRGAPRDALVGEITPPPQRGAAYGLRQSLDTVGAVLGPLVALALMAIFAGDFRRVFWLATIPGLAAVAVLVVGVREPSRPRPLHRPRAPIRPSALPRLGGAFWAVVAVGSVFTLARFSEAFLILRAKDAGLSVPLAPVVLVVMNLVYAGSAYPIGALSDRLDRWTLLLSGFVVLVAADLVLAFGLTPPLVLLGAALWGLHMGATQGLLAALVADAAPVAVRATAFGLFHLVGGGAILLASVIAGVLWDRVGPHATFLVSAGFTLLGMIGALALRRPHRTSLRGAPTFRGMCSGITCDRKRLR
jgi:MFS family permease